MRRKYLVVIACFLSLTLTACQDKVIDNSCNENISVSDKSTTNANISNESKEEAEEGYTAYTNFVKKNGSGEFELIFDKLEYNGGEFDIDVEFEFDGYGKEAELVDALAMFFVDGYIQEFSLDNDDNAFVHKITIQNNELMHINFKSVLKTYDKILDKHMVCAVILPYWRLGNDIFYRDNAKMSMAREITLNTVNSSEDDGVVAQMNIREKTDWDREHSELPFKHGDVNTDITFHCFEPDETFCYVFCDGELLTQDGKFIFESSNTNQNKTTYQNICVEDSDVGKSLFVLYVSKNCFEVETTCNYLWTERE